MSVFPTKILLATDGSGGAALATRAASDLSRKTGSELHVVHIGQGSWYPSRKECHPLLLHELAARE